MVSATGADAGLRSVVCTPADPAARMSSGGLRGVRILAPVPPEYATILTPEALAFVAHLARCYGKRVEALLAERETVQARYDAGVKPDFLPETRHVRESEWQVQ